MQLPNKGTDLQTIALLSAVVFFVVLLLAAGLAFTVHEFKRLSAESEGRKLAVRDARSRAQHPQLSLATGRHDFKWRGGWA